MGCVALLGVPERSGRKGMRFDATEASLMHIYRCTVSTGSGASFWETKRRTLAHRKSWLAVANSEEEVQQGGQTTFTCSHDSFPRYLSSS